MRLILCCFFDRLDNEILLRSRDRKIKEANQKAEKEKKKAEEANQRAEKANNEIDSILDETKESIIKYIKMQFHEDISDFISTFSKQQIRNLQKHLYDFEEFEDYLKVYQTPDGRTETNSRVGIARKLSCLRSFYEYLCKRQLLSENPVRLIDMPRLKEKAIIQLDPDEIASLLDYMENYGNGLTGVQLYHYNKQSIVILQLLPCCSVRASVFPSALDSIFLM